MNTTNQFIFGALIAISIILITSIKYTEHIRDDLLEIINIQQEQINKLNQ